MTDLVSQLVAELEDMRGKVIELCQTYGNALPHGSLERTDAALTAAKAGGWVPIETAPMTDRVFDLICNAIDEADTLTMEGDYMMDSDDCIAVVRVMQALLHVHRGITQRADGGEVE